MDYREIENEVVSAVKALSFMIFNSQPSLQFNLFKPTLTGYITHFHLDVCVCVCV